MPFTLLFPCTPRPPLCGPEVTLRASTIPVDGAGALPSRRGQEGGGVRPGAVAAEAVPVAAHGLPRAEILGRRSPAATLGPEVKTAVDHRTDVLGQGRVGLEQGSDQPLHPKWWNVPRGHRPRGSRRSSREAPRR